MESTIEERLKLQSDRIDELETRLAKNERMTGMALLQALLAMREAPIWSEEEKELLLKMVGPLDKLEALIKGA